MPNVAHRVRGPSGAPPTKHTVRAMAATTIVVPRLGWSMTSVAMTASTTMTGRSVARVLCMYAARRASRSATHSTSASLASSEGWNVSGPTPIQRVAPLAPVPMTSTSPSSPTATSTNGPDSRRQRW